MSSQRAAGLKDMQWERYRGELTGYCYRMLGSPFEAEDAVQETLERAWRNLDRYDERRGGPRSWLYAIATNVCLDMLRGAQRRARAVDLGPPARPGPEFGQALGGRDGVRWVLPIPDARVLPDHADPAEVAMTRETIRLAFVAALQHLPPRQRAVLILREVLRWKATEVAGLLGITVAAVNSALQRARAAIRAADPAPSEPLRPLDGAQLRLLAGYCDAFERHDIDRLVALLHEDATMSMPPFAWWLRGRADIRTAASSPDATCHGSRLVPVAASGSPAFAHYTPTGPGGAFEPRALVLIEISAGRIAATTSFLETERLFPLFGLPTDEFRRAASYVRT